MQTLETFSRAAAVVLAMGLVAGCAGGSIPVAEQHPGGPDIGAVLEGNRTETGFKTTTTMPVAAADAVAGRVAPSISSTSGPGGTAAAVAAHAAGPVGVHASSGGGGGSGGSGGGGAGSGH